MGSCCVKGHTASDDTEHKPRRKRRRQRRSHDGEIKSPRTRVPDENGFDEEEFATSQNSVRDAHNDDDHDDETTRQRSTSPGSRRAESSSSMEVAPVEQQANNPLVGPASGSKQGNVGGNGIKPPPPQVHVFKDDPHEASSRQASLVGAERPLSEPSSRAWSDAEVSQASSADHDKRRLNSVSGSSHNGSVTGSDISDFSCRSPHMDMAKRLPAALFRKALRIVIAQVFNESISHPFAIKADQYLDVIGEGRGEHPTGGFGLATMHNRVHGILQFKVQYINTTFDEELKKAASEASKVEAAMRLGASNPRLIMQRYDVLFGSAHSAVAAELPSPASHRAMSPRSGSTNVPGGGHNLSGNLGVSSDDLDAHDFEDVDRHDSTPSVNPAPTRSTFTACMSQPIGARKGWRGEITFDREMLALIVSGEHDMALFAKVFFVDAFVNANDYLRNPAAAMKSAIYNTQRRMEKVMNRSRPTSFSGSGLFQQTGVLPFCLSCVYIRNDTSVSGTMGDMERCTGEMFLVKDIENHVVVPMSRAGAHIVTSGKEGGGDSDLMSPKSPRGQLQPSHASSTWYYDVMELMLPQPMSPETSITSATSYASLSSLGRSGKTGSSDNFSPVGSIVKKGVRSLDQSLGSSPSRPDPSGGASSPPLPSREHSVRQRGSSKQLRRQSSSDPGNRSKDNSSDAREDSANHNPASPMKRSSLSWLSATSLSVPSKTNMPTKPTIAVAVAGFAVVLATKEFWKAFDIEELWLFIHTMLLRYSEEIAESKGSKRSGTKKSPRELDASFSSSSGDGSPIKVDGMLPNINSDMAKVLQEEARARVAPEDPEGAENITIAIITFM